MTQAGFSRFGNFANADKVLESAQTRVPALPGVNASHRISQIMETSSDTRTHAGEDHVGLLPMPCPEQHENQNKDGGHVLPRIGHSPFARSKIQAIGIWNMILLSAGFLISTALSGFLGFLWSTPPDCDLDHGSCRLWRSIVLSNHAALSTAVAISSAVLRTTLSLQAGVALSMVAALAIESVAGVPIEFVPLVLTLRGLGASVYQLLIYIWATFRSAPLYNVCALCLIITTLASQLASTLLISNLGPGFVVGEPVKTKRYLGVSIDGDIDFDYHQPQYWFGSTREYPSFAESASSLHGSPEMWKTDTGSTFESFFTGARSREKETA
ncbi:hypothetical protein V8F06_005023 [Rhypophila decipiens]